jgi:hypothetical protein
MVMLVEGEMPMAAVSKTVKETAPRISRIFHHWVSKSQAAIDLSAVRRIGVDETSSRKGHRYITQFVDLDTRRLIFATEERGKGTFDEFVKELEFRGCRRENIQVVSIDLAGSFIAGYFEYFSHAGLVFDKFHIVKLLNNLMIPARPKVKGKSYLKDIGLPCLGMPLTSQKSRRKS